MIQTLSQHYQNMIQKRSIRKLSTYYPQNTLKTIPEWSEHDPKMLQTWCQNMPKSSLGRTGNRSPNRQVTSQAPFWHAISTQKKSMQNCSRERGVRPTPFSAGLRVRILPIIEPHGLNTIMAVRQKHQTQRTNQNQYLTALETAHWWAARSSRWKKTVSYTHLTLPTICSV